LFVVRIQITNAGAYTTYRIQPQLLGNKNIKAIKESIPTQLKIEIFTINALFGPAGVFAMDIYVPKMPPATLIIEPIIAPHIPILLSSSIIIV